MSAPDVERLVEALNKLGEPSPDHGPICSCKVCWPRIQAYRIIEAHFVALSSHPDPLPASADIAGRLAREAAEKFRTNRYHRYRWDADSGVHDELVSIIEVAIRTAYRANPSGWIPVGDRLPEEGKRVLLSGHASDDPEEIDVVVLDQGEWLDKWGNVYDIDGTKWQPLPPPPQEGHSGRIYTDPKEIDAAQRREGKVCDENCSRCSGEYCNIHGSYGCECDCIARHSKP